MAPPDGRFAAPAPSSASTSASVVTAAAALLVLLLLAAPAIANRPVVETTRCHDVPSQSGLNYGKLGGRWFVVEVVSHLPKGPRAETVWSTQCPRLDVTPPLPGEPAQEARLRLRWEEDRKDVLYSLRQPEATHGGYWIADTPQNGTMTQSRHYRQFDGAVLVMKATAMHVVLTLCEHPADQRSPPGEGPQDRNIYSIVLARESQLPLEDLGAINTMLQYRGLHETKVKRTCKNFRNAAPGRQDGVTTVLVTILISVAALVLLPP